MDPQSTFADSGNVVAPANTAGGGPGTLPKGQPSAPPPVRSAAAPRRRKPGRLSVATRRARLNTVPGRIRLWTAAAALLIVALFVITNSAFGSAREGLEVIGREAGPQVVATSTLYFALSDMDAQVAEVLLIGKEHTLGNGRDQALQLYERRRAEANRALRQAAVLAGGDPTAQATVDAVLDKLGEYEGLASRAIMLDEQAKHPAGPPPEQVMSVYRQAGDVMRLELLPKASNLTLDNAVIVRSTYEEKRSAVLAGRLWVAAVGGVLIVVLVGMQIYLARRFRRAINPGLGIATLVSLLVVGASFVLLSGEASHLKVAKEDGFDSTLALSRARAMSHDANADQSRYLIDLRWSDRYEQVYLDKSKQLLGVEATNTAGYVTALNAALGKYRTDGTVGFMGFYGTELRATTSPRERQAAQNLLARYLQYQQDDRRMRDLVAENKRHDAIVFRVTRTPGNSAYDFEQYDKGIVSLIEIHQATFATQIASGERVLGGLYAQLPAAAVMIIALILLGVRPRLAEYR